MEEDSSSSGLKRKLDLALQEFLRDVQHYVHFTLQQAYFKCSYECFDLRRSSDDIADCVERCSIPVLQANSVMENEVNGFQDRLSRSLMVCQDKLEARKMVMHQPGGSTEAFSQEFEQCVNSTVNDHIKMIPGLALRIKSQMPKEGEVRRHH